MSMQLVCTSKNMWAELSYEFGPSCLINLGRVGMGRVLCGPSWHGPSWFWAELSVIQMSSRYLRQRRIKSEGIRMLCLQFSKGSKFLFQIKKHK